MDHVAAQLLKQGRRSTSNGHDCVYRAPDGCKCAAGHLIDDQFYHPSFERRAVPQPFSSMGDAHKTMVEAFVNSGVDLHDREVYHLVHALQRVHDGYEPNQWRRKLHDVARRFNINCHTLNDANH